VLSFTPGETATGSCWIGGWLGLKAGLDAVEKRKISCLYRESNRDTDFEETRMKQVVLAACLMLVSCLAHCSTLKKEAVYPSETVEFHQPTQRYIPEYNKVSLSYRFGSHDPSLGR
jgi:hypothetical protein